MEKLTIGPYLRTATPDQAFNLVDEYGFHRMTNGNDPGDSLGGNFRLLFCYDDPLIPKASAEMWYFNSQGKYVGQRHPTLPPEDHPMSRDHYTTTLLTLKLFNIRHHTTLYDAKIKEIHDNTGYIISSMARRTLGLKLWSKAIQGDKWSEFGMYMLEIVTVAFVYLPVYMLGSLIANFKPEVDQWEWVKNDNLLQAEPEYKQWIDKIIYPSYSMLLSGWRLYILNGFPLLKRILKALYRPMIGETNYVQKMLFGKKNIEREYVQFFDPMKGGRWSGWLNNRNDRNMEVLTSKPSYNNIDVDIARKLYNETQ